LPFHRYYGYSGSTFYVSTNGGATFVKTAATGLPTLTAGTDKAIKAVPGIEGDVWIAGGTGGLFHSVNNGTSFTNLTVVTSAVSVGFGKAAPGLTYPAIYIVGKVSGVNGFFRSDDAGVTWVRINDDLHQYGTANQALTGDPRIYGRVYIGTNGLGAVYGDIVGTVTNSTGTTT
jgi:xyloglucan-specific exo-beta-1,4-glucanase